MQNSLFTLIWDAGRFALYALVIGPALALYALVVVAALNGSLSQQFLTEARRLTDGAAPGQVMQCINKTVVTDLQPRIPHNTEHVPPLQSALSFCHPEPVDSAPWVRTTDAVLFNFWMIAALAGALSGFLVTRRRKAETFSDTRSLLFKKGQSDEH